MITENKDEVIRGVIREALDDCPALLPQDRRYADDGGQRIAKDLVSLAIMKALRSGGFLSFDPGQADTSMSYHAVSYTMGRMRTRLTKHYKRDDRTCEVEHAGMREVACAFFGDLEERGWRLVRIYTPGGMNNHLGSKRD